MKKFLLCAAALAFGVACGHKSSGSGEAKNPASTDLPQTPLTGQIAGQPWTAVTAVARKAPGSTTDLWLEITDAKIERACDSFSWPFDGAMRKLIATADPSVGVKEKSETSGQSMTIYVRPATGEGTNYISFGALSLDEVTRSEVKGKINITYDAGNTAKGAFTAQRCLESSADPNADFQADATPDAALVGAWKGPIGSLPDWTWSMKFLEGGTATAKLSIPGDDAVEDADESWQTDSGVTPHRLIRKVAKSRADTNGLENPADTKYCVYGYGADATKLLFGCSNSTFPLDLPVPGDAAMVLTKS